MNGAAYGDVLDGICAEESDSAVHTGNMILVSVISGIDQFQNARCQRRVFSDDFGNVFETAILFVAGFHELKQDVWECWDVFEIG